MGELDEIARRAWRRTIPIAIGAFVVGALIGAFLPGSDSALGRFLSIVGFGLCVGGLSGTFSLLTATFRVAPSLQLPLRGLSRADQRGVRRAVISGRPIEPTRSELAHRAFDWAQGAAVALPVSLGQFLLLYAGIAGPQVPNLIRDDAWNPEFPRVFIAALVVVAIVFSVVLGRQIRGARRYLAATNDR
jgi:hypothetical protein